MKTIYLDMNIYNRPFDDQSQIRIRMESLAVNVIFQKVGAKELKLVWSFILDYENSLNPYEHIRIEIEKLSLLASEIIMLNEVIENRAKIYESKGIKPRDALHLACSVESGAEYFITCDDRIIKKQGELSLDIIIINPIEFIVSAEEKRNGIFD